MGTTLIHDRKSIADQRKNEVTIQPPIRKTVANAT